MGRTSFCCDRFDHASHPGFGACIHNDLRAFLRKPARNGFTNALSGAGDNGYFAVQAPWFRLFHDSTTFLMPRNIFA